MSTTVIDRQGVATALANALRVALPAGIAVWDRPQSFPYGQLNTETLPALIVEVGNGTIEEVYAGGLWGSERVGGNLYILHYLQALPEEGTASTSGATVSASVTALHANVMTIMAALISYTVSTLSGQIQQILKIEQVFDGVHNIVDQYLGTFIGCRLMVHLVELDYASS